MTRHLASRPTALARCQASLAALDGAAWTQTVLVDDVGRGTAWANLRLRELEPVGQWVWVLDDDNRSFMLAPVVTHLAGLAPDVDLVVALGDHGPLGVLPPVDDRWGAVLPDEGRIGSFNVLVRADLWRAARAAWTGRYEGDYDFIRAAWALARGIQWLPAVLCGVQRISRGAPEDVS